MNWRTKSIEDLRQESEAHPLKKTLSWPHLIAMGVGAIIGMGIFTLTALGAKLAGPGVILSFALAGTVCALAALCYAEVSTIIPASGSAYTYSYTVMGELAAWLIGFALVLEYALGSSAVAVGWAKHVIGFLQESQGLSLPAAFLAGPFEGGTINLFAMGIVLLITGLLLLGTRESALLNMLLVALKLSALTAFIVVAGPSIQAGNYQPFMPYGFYAQIVDGEKVGVMAAAAIMFFAFYGFDAVSTAAEETKNPGRDLTIGITGSMVICTIFYMLIAAVALGTLNHLEFAKTNDEPLPYILRQLGQPWVADFVSLAAIVSMPSVLLVFMYGQSRILFVMSRDGLIPASLAKVNKKGIPGLMTLLTGLFVAVFAGLVPLQDIASLANAGTLCAFIAVSLTLIILRIKRPDIERPFKTPLWWLVAPGAIAGCLFLFTSLNEKTLLYFFGWIVIGLLVYLGYGLWHSNLKSKSS
jgi:APA family basic amino acid/polyamine antiporter